MEKSDHNTLGDFMSLPLDHMADRTDMVDHDAQLTSQDPEEIWIQSMRDALTLFGLSYVTNPVEDLETEITPSSSRSTAPSANFSTRSASSTALAVSSVERKRRRVAALQRKRRQAEANNEYSKYRFQKVQAGGYIMLSMMNGEELPLKDKVASSLAFGQEMRPEDRNRLLQRLLTLISCLEARYKQRHTVRDGASRPARTERKRELCKALTEIINICSSGDETSVAIEHDIWDVQLRVFEVKWISWHPGDKDLITRARDGDMQDAGCQDGVLEETASTDDIAPPMSYDGISWTTVGRSSSQPWLTTAVSSFSVPLGPAEDNKTSASDSTGPGQGSTSNAAIPQGEHPKRHEASEYYFRRVLSSDGKFTYRMHLRDGSVMREKLDEEGLQFSSATPPNLTQEILDRLKAFIHRLEASHKQSAPESLGEWYRGAFAQRKTVVAREITAIVIRKNLKGFSDPVGYDVWDDELKKLDEMWDLPRPRQGADDDSVIEDSFHLSCGPGSEEHLTATSATVASAHKRGSGIVDASSARSEQGMFIAQHILDPHTGETVPWTSSLEDSLEPTNTAPSASSPASTRTRKPPWWWCTMDREEPHSEQIVLNIAIGSKEEKAPASRRVEQAFPVADDPIKGRLIHLITTLQTQYGTSSRDVEAPDSNGKLSLRRKVSLFIVQHLPQSLTKKPRKEDSPAQRSARLDELETLAKKLGWEVKQ